jgi:cell division protein FtsQ
MSGATLAGRRRAAPRRTVARLLRALSPRLRRRLACVAVLSLVAAAGYQFWLRDSALVAVDEVTVTGLTTADANRVKAALTATGKTMTTLRVDETALERAVDGFPVVRALEVTPDFPHGLDVHVVEYVPAALAVAESGRVRVAGDGTILRGVPVERRLPTIDVEGALGGERLLDPVARGAVAVAGRAPTALRGRIAAVERREGEGYVAVLREGPELIFGGATRLRSKWAAAARVLADLEARGASYVDLRIPGRPAVGGLSATTVAPVVPAGTALDGPPAGSTITSSDPAATGESPATGTVESPATGTVETPVTELPAATTEAAGGGVAPTP